MKLVDGLGFASVVSLGCDALAECFSRTGKLNLLPSEEEYETRRVALWYQGFERFDAIVRRCLALPPDPRKRDTVIRTLSCRELVLEFLEKCPRSLSPRVYFCWFNIALFWFGLFGVWLTDLADWLID